MSVKQKSIHNIYVIGRVVGLCLGLCGLCTIPRPSRAQKLPETSGGGVASVRLIAAGGTTKGVYRTGVAIAMPTGSHTYWKQPGDAGVPPVFAFNDSVNITKAEVLFPAPTRITEDGLDAFGYTDAVVFPVLVTPGDPAKPSSLHLDLSYAVCNKICIPGHSTADLALPAKNANEETGAVDAAFALVPRQLSQADQADLTVKRVSGAQKPTWTIAWTGRTIIRDIFADAPEGYAFETKAALKPGTWTLVASQSALVSSTKIVPVTLTLAGQPESFVTTQMLDVVSVP